MQEFLNQEQARERAFGWLPKCASSCSWAPWPVRQRVVNGNNFSIEDNNWYPQNREIGFMESDYQAIAAGVLEDEREMLANFGEFIHQLQQVYGDRWHQFLAGLIGGLLAGLLDESG